jgi:hypothetical protein
MSEQVIDQGVPDFVERLVRSEVILQMEGTEVSEIEILGLIEEIRNKISRVRAGGHKVDESVTAKNEVDHWKESRLIDFAHGRYLAIMTSQNVDVSRIVSRRKFNCKAIEKWGGKSTPYQMFRAFEKSGLKIGDEVLYNNKCYRLRGLSPQCYCVLIPIGKKGSKLNECGLLEPIEGGTGVSVSVIGLTKVE